MDDILQRKTLGFSQGERMKVALARALMHEPPYLILDEPTNGLDVLTTRAVRSLLQALKHNGTCLIFSSHLMHEVSYLCDQLTVITHGQVSARGTPDDIIQQTGSPDLEAAFAHLCTRSGPRAAEHDEAKTP